MTRKLLSVVMAFLLMMTIVSFASAESTVLTLQAEQSSLSSKATVTAGSSVTYASVKETGYLTFDISLAASGFYMLNLRASGQNLSSVNLSLDSVPLHQMNLRQTSADTTFDDNFALLELPSGTHTLKISSTSGVMNLDYLTLTYLNEVTKATCDSFLEEINSAEKTEECRTAFETYASAFGIDVSTLTSKIFYKAPIYEGLIGKNFDELNDAIKAFYDLVTKYQLTVNQPVVAYKGRPVIYELTSGDLKFNVKTAKLESPTTIICAIYKNNALYKFNIGNYTTETSVNIEIPGVEIDGESEYEFKVFYLENLTSLSTYSIFGRTYKEIFVAPGGKDTFDGSRENPLKTISAAKAMVAELNSKMTGDIIVNIAPGEYFLSETETLTSVHSGKNGHNVIFKGTDKNNPPIIHGGKKITGWQEHEGGIYKAELKGMENVRNLYVDGYQAVRARSENNFKAEAFYDDAQTENYAIDGVKVLKKRMPYSFSRPQDLEMVWELGWSCHRINVDRITDDGDYKVFKVSSLDAMNKDLGTEAIRIDEGKYFYLENALELLDKPGEFYFNPDEEMIYYYPQQSETLDNVYAPVTERLFEIGSKAEGTKTENIIFDNLDIRYGAWNEVSELGFLQVQADSIIDLENPQGSKMMHSQFAVNNASGIKIVNCSFSCLGSNAISMEDAVADSKIEGNVIRDISGAAISIGTWGHTIGATGVEMCRNIDISNNLIRRTSQEYRGTTAISVYYENSINICHNDISDLPYTGVSVGWGWGEDVYTMGNFSICHNKVTDVMNCLLDGSFIYTLGPLKESAIYENYLEDSGYVIAGVYNDQGSAYAKIFRNVIIDDEDTYWWFQGINRTKELHAFENYTTSQKIRVAEEADNVEENTIYVTENSLPDAARQIKESAGLEEGYKHLLLKAELPENKTNIGKTSPKKEYSSGVMLYSTEYDRSYDYTDGNNIPIDSREYLSFNRNDWVEYDFELDEAGTYSLVLSAANGWEDDYTSTVKIYVDGVLKFTANIGPTDGWGDYREFVIGNLTLGAGKKTIKILNSTTEHAAGFHLSRIILEK